MLRAASGRLATKVIERRDDGTVWKRGFDAEKYFSVQHVHVRGFRSLAMTLTGLARDPRACVIRGQALPGINTERARRLLHADPLTGEAPSFKAADRRWLGLDFDGILCPVGVDPREDPEDAARHLAGKLPDEFSDASFWWQWTSSQGFKEGTLNARLWYWLDRPIPDAELARWAAWVNRGGHLPETERETWLAHAGPRLVDPALFRAIQPHYVAAPLFRNGLTDPLRRRYGVWQGLEDEVAIVIPPPEALPAPTIASGAAGRGGGLGFEGYLARIGGADGFNTAIYKAILSYLGRHGAGADLGLLKSRLQAAILAADSGGRSAQDIARYASDRYLDDEIRRAVARRGWT